MPPESKKKWPFVLGAVVVVLLGVGVAWLLSGKMGPSRPENAAPGSKVTETEAGRLDPNVQYDTAEGVLQEGGLNGEGTYHLVREGGASKTVYLTSSVVDLGMFNGKRVEVWGQTLASKTVPWLMDVAKIKLAE